MSFQDFGVGGAAQKRARSPLSPGLARVDEAGGWGSPSPTAGSPGGGGGAGDAYSRVSDGIVQYRKNVRVLQDLAKRVGGREDGPVLQKQYRTQCDVVLQLGGRIELQLSEAEAGMGSLGRVERERSRATHQKLMRDYRRVEQTYKNLLLDVKRKKGLAEARRREEEEQRAHAEGGTSSEAVRLQMQMQEERVAEEIMREREEEIRNINKGMHTVNEIYKDLAHIVGSQQEQIDAVEEHMEQANTNTEAGLKQIEKANDRADSSYGCIIS